MVTLLIHNDAARFAEHLARLSPDERCEAMANAVREAGGEYPADITDRTGADRTIFEVSYCGIVAWGACEQNAIQSWIYRARNTAALDEAS